MLGYTDKERALQRQHPYVCRSQEKGRKRKRHSNFWIGLYGHNWIVAFHQCQVWVEELISSIRMGAGILSQRFESYGTYTASTLASLSPPQHNKSGHEMQPIVPIGEQCDFVG